MPVYSYRGRDTNGKLRSGQHFADTVDSISTRLTKDGIIPLEITLYIPKKSRFKAFFDLFKSRRLLNEELAIFARQMQLLHNAGVPITLSLKQLASYTRSPQLTAALQGIIEYLEQGQNLATSMQYFPEVFSPLAINLIEIGENSGHLSETFGHLYKYLEFEISHLKQLKTALRYPSYVLVSILLATIVLNIFVIPAFASLYSKMGATLPWQTRVLLMTSNLFVHDGLYILIGAMGIGYLLSRYLRTAKGKYRWHRLQLRLPVIGQLLRRIMLIRFTQSLAIVLNSGLLLTNGLGMVKNILQNAYYSRQITSMQEVIERGNTFSQAITTADLFSPLEQQIIAVGENNGELGPALDFIADFHSREIEYDLTRLSDLIGPIVLGFIAILVLIMALGIYLPIWNMVTLVH